MSSSSSSDNQSCVAKVGSGSWQVVRWFSSVKVGDCGVDVVEGGLVEVCLEKECVGGEGGTGMLGCGFESRLLVRDSVVDVGVGFELEAVFCGKGVGSE